MSITILLTTIISQTLIVIPLAALTVILILAMTGGALIYYDRLYHHIERRESRSIHHHNQELALILRSEQTYVWTYDVLTRKYQRISTDGQLENEYTPIDFSRFFDRDEFEELRAVIFSVRDGVRETATLLIHGPKGIDGDEQKRYEIRLSVYQRDETGVPTIILGTQRDITYEKQRREREREELLTFQNVFNSSLVDMVFYDENGFITDINDSACRTFQIKDKAALINARQHLKEVSYFEHTDIKQLEQTHCTTLIDVEAMEIQGRKAMSVERKGQLYYEIMLYPISDESGEMLGFFLQGRDTTDLVESFKMQRESMRELQKTTEELKKHIENINLALQTAECRIMTYLPDKHSLQITSDLNLPQYELSQIRALDCIHPDCRLKARRLMNQLDHCSIKKVEERLKTVFKDQRQQNIWLTFIGVPVYGKDERIIHYFGMSRNDTKIINTENRLKAETQKALEAETVKNAFLLNMSYEIRTPLANVLGFAELFDKEHDPDDEHIFAEEIKKNSNALLNLVNDILYISRIDAKMIELKKQPTDFAAVFDAHCHMGWSANMKPDIKAIVENPYEHLTVVIDEELTGKIIEQLASMSIFYTKEGMVRAKYEYRQGALNITIEDTGRGFSQEVLPHIFDRFGRNKNEEQFGTGLLLPIVKGLTELMGGIIEITSEKGKGTTAWVSIPCELISSEKKKQII